MKDNSLVIITEGLTCWTQCLIHQLDLHSTRQTVISLWISSGLLFFYVHMLQKPGLLLEKKTMQPEQPQTFNQAGNFLGKVSGMAKLNFTEE